MNFGRLRQFASELRKRFLPGYAFPLTFPACADASQRMRKSIWMMNALHRHGDTLEADTLEAGIRKGGGLDFQDTLVFYMDVHRAGATAIGRANRANDAIRSDFAARLHAI